MNPSDELLHVGDLGGGNLPISAELIAAVVVVGLPAVIHDHGVHSKRFGKLTFLDDILHVKLLVVAVPQRVHGKLGVLGNVGRRIATLLLPPRHGIVYRVVIGDLSGVNANGGGVFLEGSHGNREEIDLPLNTSILLALAAPQRAGRLGIRERYGHAVFARCRNQRVNGHPGSQTRFGGTLFPVGTDVSLAANAGTPNRIRIYVRNTVRNAELLGNSLVLQHHMNVEKKDPVLLSFVVKINFGALVAACDGTIPDGFPF